MKNNECELCHREFDRTAQSKENWFQLNSFGVTETGIWTKKPVSVAESWNYCSWHCFLEDIMAIAKELNPLIPRPYLEAKFKLEQKRNSGKTE